MFPSSVESMLDEPCLSLDVVNETVVSAIYGSRIGELRDRDVALPDVKGVRINLHAENILFV